MKIMICGSMCFAKNMLEAQGVLEELGFEVSIPVDTHECLENPDLNMDFEYCLNTDIDLQCFQLVVDADAILVLNYPKNNIDGYIGGATLMEIGLARYFGRQIFVLNNLPDEDILRYALEIRITSPVVLGGDIRKIIEYI